MMTSSASGPYPSSTTSTSVGELPGIYVRMNAEMYDELVTLADDAGCSVAELIRVGLAHYLDEAWTNTGATSRTSPYEPIVRGRKKVG